MKRLLFLLLLIPVLSFGQVTKVTTYGGKALTYGSKIVTGYDELFWLDGTISGDEFVDITGHGRNFTITGKDFADDWVSGFPYKSAATISAPVGDATLIANDVNNFLYDTAGDPNEIPVVSFFQNIDYENKIFARHVAQTVDGNGVETYEPRVAEIVMYGDILTGTDLTTANTYYSVPTEAVTNVKWVTKDGDDDTGDGTKALPWLTQTKANASGTTDDTIYSKTGVYSYATWLYIFKRLTWKALGCVELDHDAYGWLCYSDITGTLIERFIVKGRDAAENIFYLTGSSTINKCKSYNTTGYALWIPGTATGISNDCVILGKLLNENSLTFNGSFLNGQIYNRTVGKLITLNNCRADYNSAGNYFLNGGAGATQGGNALILGGDYNVINSSIFIYIGLKSTSIDIQYADFKVTALSGSVVGGLSDVACDLAFKRNTVTSNGAGAIISTNGLMNSEVENNVIQQNTGNTGIQIARTTAGATSTVLINNNVLNQVLATSYGIMAGNEGTSAGDDLISDITITNNIIKGAFYYDIGAAAAAHGILVGFQTNPVNIKYNNIAGSHFAAAIKNDAGDCSNTIIQSNIFTNNLNYGIVGAGAENFSILNNTLVNNATEIYLYANIGANGADGITIKNNIIIGETSASLINWDANSGTGHTIDYNIYYSPLATPFIVAGVAKTWAEWQALGYDEHSVMLGSLAEAKALFTDYDNGDYSLIDGSAAIGTGETLAAAYDDGLDASADWGDATTVPTVVTKQQTGSWDIGAYIK